MSAIRTSLRRMVLNRLPPRIRSALKRAKQQYYLERKRADQIAWIVQGYDKLGRLPLVRAGVRRWLLPRRRLLFYPNHPSRGSVFFKSCVLLGYATTNRPDRPHHVAVRYGNQPEHRRQLQDIPPATPILNLHSNDISKTTVQTVFAQVFGYPLAVDPTRYRGNMVEKSDANATHDGRIVTGPIPPDHVRPGCVYQKAVDNAAPDGEHTIDLRVPVIGEHIPMVYVKWRPPHNRFGRESIKVELKAPDEVLTPAEQAKIIELGRRMGVDLAEMDVLRDNHDGQIYVVDVNNTPSGPNGLTREGRVDALDRWSRSFESVVERAIAEQPPSMS